MIGGQRQIATLALTVCIIGGCQTQQKVDSSVVDRHSANELPQSVPIPNLDPGAMRLQDISGALLFYFAEHRALPATLKELKPLDSDEPLNMISPISKKPYVYTPDGIVLQDKKTRLIVYDPSPGPNGYREAIIIDEPVVGQPLVTKVIAVPEWFFLLHPPIK